MATLFFNLANFSVVEKFYKTKKFAEIVEINEFI